MKCIKCHNIYKYHLYIFIVKGSYGIFVCGINVYVYTVAHMYIMHMIYNASIYMYTCMHMHIYVCAYYNVQWYKNTCKCIFSTMYPYMRYVWSMYAYVYIVKEPCGIAYLFGMLNLLLTKESINMQLLTHFNKCWTIRRDWFCT